MGGATEFFTSLQERDDKAIPGSHYFASHPQMAARIAALRAQAAAAGMREDAVQRLDAAK